MPNEMTPLEAAEKLESLVDYAGDTLDDALEFNLRKTVDAAASYLRQIAAGEYKPVVHAKWRLIDLTGIKSDVPYVKYAHVECTHCRGVESSVLYSRKICPSCGALMGKDDSHD